MKINEAILLVNIGGVENLEEMYSFLRAMFNDKHILKVPWGIRHMLSFIISNSRYKKSWEKYKLIKGSNVKKETLSISKELEILSKTKVYTAFSYSKPYINDVLNEIIKDDIKNLKVLTLYPQNSYSTTKSVYDEIEKKFKKTNICYSFTDEYCINKHFISYWINLINKHIEENNIKKDKLLLLFSAHSIPQNLVKKGDKYIQSVEKMSKIIANKLNLNYDIAYQSKLGPVKWVGPFIDDYIKILIEEKKENNIIILPISFVNECLETSFDLDLNVIALYKDKINISRVKFPSCDKNLIECFNKIIN